MKFSERVAFLFAHQPAARIRTVPTLCLHNNLYGAKQYLELCPESQIVGHFQGPLPGISKYRIRLYSMKISNMNNFRKIENLVKYLRRFCFSE